MHDRDELGAFFASIGMNTSAPKQAHSNCWFSHSTVFETLEKQSNWTCWDKVTELSVGIIAVLFPPITVLNTITNVALVFLLTFKIRCLQRLELWIILVILADLVSMYSYLFTDALVSFIFPWWGLYMLPHNQTSSLKCKLVKGVIEMSNCLRCNLTMVLVAHQVFGDREKRSVSEILLLVFLCVVLSVLLSAPTALIHDLWQHRGVFNCLPSPLWPKAYHTFFAVHKILYLDGFLQSLVSLCLLVLLWSKYKTDRRVYKRMHLEPSAINLISTFIKKTENEIKLCYGNNRMVVWITAPSCILRIIRCTVLTYAFCLFGVIDISSEPCKAPGNRERSNTFYCIWNTLFFVEIMTNSLHFLYWAVFTSEIRHTLKVGWEILIGLRRANATETPQLRVKRHHIVQYTEGYEKRTRAIIASLDNSLNYIRSKMS